MLICDNQKLKKNLKKEGYLCPSNPSKEITEQAWINLRD